MFWLFLTLYSIYALVQAIFVAGCMRQHSTILSTIVILTILAPLTTIALLINLRRKS